MEAINPPVQLIPKVIYQNAEKVGIATEKMLSKNPAYRYHPFNDTECERFIEAEFGQTERDVFHSLSGSQRTEFWRYCILYKRGGIYIAPGVNVTKSLDDLIKPNDTEFFVYGDTFNIEHQIFGAQPRSELMRNAIDLAVQRIRNKDRDDVIQNVVDVVPESDLMESEQIVKVCNASGGYCAPLDTPGGYDRYMWWSTGPVLLGDVLYRKITGRPIESGEHVFPIHLKQRLMEQLFGIDRKLQSIGYTHLDES